MNYGWLDVHPAGSQHAGFFIDEENRIFYWPTPDSAGYEIDFAASQQIQEMRHHYISHRIPNIFFAIFMIGSLYFQSILYPYVEPLIGKLYFILILGFSPSIAFTVLFWRFLGLRWFLQDASVFLIEDKRLNLDQPAAQSLKPSEWLPKWAIFGLLILSVVFVVQVLSISQKPADYLLSFILIIIVFGRMAWSQWHGMRRKDIRLFKSSG